MTVEAVFPVEEGFHHLLISLVFPGFVAVSDTVFLLPTPTGLECHIHLVRMWQWKGIVISVFLRPSLRLIFQFSFADSLQFIPDLIVCTRLVQLMCSWKKRFLLGCLEEGSMLNLVEAKICVNFLWHKLQWTNLLKQLWPDIAVDTGLNVFIHQQVTTCRQWLSLPALIRNYYRGTIVFQS